MLLLCFIISIINVLLGNISYTDIFNKTGLYFLYLIGYGSLEGDAILQNILAIVGIVSLALLSTYLTINLFWRLDDVKLNKQIIFKDNILYFDFINKGKVICDFKVSFLLYDKNNKKSINSEEYSTPMILNKSLFTLDININDYFWYQSIYEILNDNKELYCLYSFVDTTNGQASIKMDKINKEYLNNISISYFKKDIVFEDIEICSNKGNIICEGNNYMYELNDKESFVMAYINFKQDELNIKKFSNMDKIFSFKVSSKNNINMIVEFKNNTGKVYEKKIAIDNDTYMKIPLEEVINKTDSLKEICFTIFGDNNKNKGKYILEDIKISDRK